MIAYGCAKRAVDINYWVKQVVSQIESDQSYDPYSIIPVITDVRFESEAIFLKKSFGKNFKLIAVNRSDAPEPTEEEKKKYRTSMSTCFGVFGLVLLFIIYILLCGFLLYAVLSVGALWSFINIVSTF